MPAGGETLGLQADLFNRGCSKSLPLLLQRPESVGISRSQESLRLTRYLGRRYVCLGWVRKQKSLHACQSLEGPLRMWRFVYALFVLTTFIPPPMMNEIQFCSVHPPRSSSSSSAQVSFAAPSVTCLTKKSSSAARLSTRLNSRPISLDPTRSERRVPHAWQSPSQPR